MRIAAWLALALTALAARPAYAADAVLFLLSERGGAYAQVADAMRRELGTVAEVTQRFSDEPSGLVQRPMRAAVAIGTGACRSLAQGNLAPTINLCVLLPRIAYDRIAESVRARGRSLSAVLLDQPETRQMALIRLALPERHRVAVLVGPETATLGNRLAASASAQGLGVSLGRVGAPEELAVELRKVLAEADVLLAIPDGAVYNGSTIQNILRSTFMKRVPLVAFSPSYVRAGALLALYSTPAQIGRQAGRTLRTALGGRELPPLQYPAEFEVGVNPHVARALAIELDDGAALAERLRRTEAAR